MATVPRLGLVLILKVLRILLRPIWLPFPNGLSSKDFRLAGLKVLLQSPFDDGKFSLRQKSKRLIDPFPSLGMGQLLSSDEWGMARALPKQPVDGFNFAMLAIAAVSQWPAIFTQSNLFCFAAFIAESTAWLGRSQAMQQHR